MAEVKEGSTKCMPHKDIDKLSLGDFNRYVRSLIAHRWEDVAVQLLREEYHKEINIIKADHPDDVKKCSSSLFTIWKERQPQDVTWRALIDAIRKADLSNEANQIEKMLMTADFSASPNNHEMSSQLDTLLSPSSSQEFRFVRVKCMVDKLDREVQQEYANFMTKLLNLFTEREVSKDNVLFTFSSLERYPAVTLEMKSATNLQAFMLALNSTQCWYNFGTMATLARTFGGNSGKELVEEYEQKLKVHLLERITCIPPENFETETIEVKVDKKKEHFTEQSIIKFRNTLAKCLKLEPEDFVFISVESGCVKLTFLFLSQHTAHIIHNIAAGTDKLVQCDVLSVIIKGEVIWQRKMSRHKKRGHDDMVTEVKRPKILSTQLCATASQNPNAATSASRPMMRSFRFLPTQQSNNGQRSVTYTALLYRIICSTTRKRMITMTAALIVLFIVLYIYYSDFVSL